MLKALLPLLERPDEDRLLRPDRVSGTEPGLSIDQPWKVPEVLLRQVGEQRFELRPALEEPPHLAVGRTQDVAAVVHDRARDGIERRGARQRGGQPVQTRCAGRQRAKARLAGAERLLHLLTFRELLIGALPERVRLHAGAKRRLELERAIERLRRPGAERQQVFAILRRPGARVAEFELHDRKHAAAQDDRHGRDSRERRRSARSDLRRGTRVLCASGDARMTRRAASNGVGRRTLRASAGGRTGLALFVLVADCPRNLHPSLLGTDEEQQARVPFERMEGLLHGGVDHPGGGAGLRESRGQLRQTVGLRSGTLGFEAARLRILDGTVNAAGQQAETQPRAAVGAPREVPAPETAV